MNKYYDESSFQYAIDKLETDPFQAKLRFEEYLERYPKDYYARAYYGLLLTRICLIDEAEAEYEYIKENSQNDQFYIRNQKDLIGFNYNMNVLKIKILAYHEQYKELLQFIYDNYYKLNQTDFNYAHYYSKIKLGIIDDKIENCSYRFLQAYNYSEELFREHIKKHLYSENNDNENIFNENFPIDNAIEEIKKYIPSEKKLFLGYFDNTYYFKYDNCGKVAGAKSNYFVVICFNNTSNIITMCPVLDCEKLPSVDLNYLNDLEEDTIKVKRLSQIEKFNRRFNLK